MTETEVWYGDVVLPEGVYCGWGVAFRGATILAVAPGEMLAEYRDTTPAETKYIFPGLIDVHAHGGGGASFPDATSLDEVKTAAGEHLHHGTTTMLASLVTASVEVLGQRAELLARACEEGIIAGIHFEGPFLSEVRCGAQDPRFLLDASPEVMKQLMEAASGWARSMTIAPERNDRAALEILVEAGAIPSWGHTDAGPAATRAAVAMGSEICPAGRRATVTHLFNGMKPLHHRDPGPIAEFFSAAASGQVALEMICDGVHLRPEVVRAVVSTVGTENCVLVTDSMAAAGMADGEYSLGPQQVRVSDGVARLADGDSIAGGTAHLIDCVRQAVVSAELPLNQAVAMASLVPATLFGWLDRGVIGNGKRADLVAVDEELRPRGVLQAGTLVS